MQVDDAEVWIEPPPGSACGPPPLVGPESPGRLHLRDLRGPAFACDGFGDRSVGCDDRDLKRRRKAGENRRQAALGSSYILCTRVRDESNLSRHQPEFAIREYSSKSIAGRGLWRVPLLERLQAGSATLSPLLGIPQDRNGSARKRLVFLLDDDSVVVGNPLCSDRVRDHRQPGGDRLEHLDLRAAAGQRREQQDRNVAHERGARGHFALDLHTVVGAKAEPVHATTRHAKPRVRQLAANERPDPVHESVRGCGRHRPAAAPDEADDRLPAVQGHLDSARDRGQVE